MDAETKQTVFNQLVQLVKDNISDNFELVEHSPHRIEVNTTKEVIIEGRKRPFVNLLSVIIQKHHVGFYYMPVYVDEGVRATLSDDLAKMLKGKSCFHCKQTLSDEHQTEIAHLIQQGVSLYEMKGWL